MSNPVKSAVRWVQTQGKKRSHSSAASQLSASHSANSLGSGRNLNQNWVHPPDALTYGRVEYTVKFLGEMEVLKPKGTDVIKEAIQKIRFQLQVKQSQGYKMPRVEIHISIEGVNIIDAKSRMVLYKYPLHRISFCADDKQDKRVFSFIAKQADSDRHNCFVFLSDKLAEEITLTIGEAFDLAYRKFLENNGKDLEGKKQVILLRKRIQELERENSELKSTLADYERRNPLSQPPTTLAPAAPAAEPSGQHRPTNWERFGSEEPPKLPTNPPPPPPPNYQSNRQVMDVLAINGPDVGRKLENLALNSLDDVYDDDFNPRAGETPRVQNGNPFLPETTASKDSFGLQPFASADIMNGNKETPPNQADFENALSAIDARLAEIREGFQRGLSFGNDDFQLADLDPLAATPGTPTEKK